MSTVLYFAALSSVAPHSAELHRARRIALSATCSRCAVFRCAAILGVLLFCCAPLRSLVFRYAALSYASLLHISLRNTQLHCVSLAAQSFIVFRCSALSFVVFNSAECMSVLLR